MQGHVFKRILNTFLIKKIKNSYTSYNDIIEEECLKLDFCNNL